MPLSRINTNSIANNTIQGADVLDASITAAKIISVANTQITGNIVSSQITSVANTQITGNIIGSQISSNTLSNTVFQTGSVENYMGAQGTSFGMRNKIINGAMAINQRNTAVTTTETYGVDRFIFVKGNDATESAAQSTDAPAGFSYSFRNTISVGDASIGATQFSGFKQNIEGYNIADLAFGTSSAKSVTVSFWVRSSVTGVYTGDIANSDFSRMCPFNFTINSANTWEYKTNTFPGCTDGTWNTTNGIGIAFQIYSALGSTYASGTANTWGSSGSNFGCGSPVNGIASNGNIFAWTGVQLEKGSQATPFEYKPYGTELSLCQRYFQTIGGPANGTNARILPSAIAYQASTVDAGVLFPVVMRTTPTLSAPSGSGYYIMYTNGGSTNFNSFALVDGTPQSCGIRAGSISTTQGYAGWFNWNSTVPPTGSIIAFIAEL